MSTITAAKVDGKLLLYAAGAVLLLVAGKKIFKAIEDLFAGLGGLTDRATDSLAQAYVNATSKPVEFASGLYIELPSGTRISPDKIDSLGGAKFRYLGVTYELVEALGGGSYRAKKV